MRRSSRSSSRRAKRYRSSIRRSAVDSSPGREAKRLRARARYSSVARPEPAGSGRAAELYLALARSRFASLPGELSTADLRMLERYLFARLELEREERRMHFGALALLSLLFFVLLPHLISGEFQ